MTPTLLGRWQSRIFLFATVGALFTLPFALGIVGPDASGIPFLVLFYLALLGLIWDVFYNYLQQFRWDRDWPAVFQLIAGLWEAIFFSYLVEFIDLPGLEPGVPLQWFAIHYSLVWLGMFAATHTLMRILFPYWRFNGGQLF